MQQFELDFEGGLTQRYPEFIDCVRASVYGCGRQFKAIASDLDLSPSELSRKLSDQTDTHFAMRRLPELMEATKDYSPIFWLVEKYCDDPESKRRKSVARLEQMLPELQRLLKSAA
jgi:hypothetical protein